MYARNVMLENTTIAWSLSSSQHAKSASSSADKCLKSIEKKRPKNDDSYLPVFYLSELDVSTELDGKGSGYYKSLAGTLRYIVELGRLGARLEVPITPSRACLPREGNL